MANLQASQLFDISGFTALVTGGGSGIGLMVRYIGGFLADCKISNTDCTWPGE